MKMQFGRSRAGTAGIIAAVIMFAMLFTVGTSYFLFVEGLNSQYTKNLVNASDKLQGSISQNLVVTSALLPDGNVGFYVNNTSGAAVNITLVYVLSSSGVVLKCDGVGLPASAGCGNTTPALWLVVNGGMGSPKIDTGYFYTSGTLTIKVVTQQGNTFTAVYPPSASPYSGLAQSSTSTVINLNSFRWEQLVPITSYVVQSHFVPNCNAATCGGTYSSPVTAGNIVVFGLGWYGHTPPATPTDTLDDGFTLAASSSVTPNVNIASLVQGNFLTNCASSTCGLAFNNPVSTGDLLVFALGWYNRSPPSTPTDTLGDTFTLGVSQNVSVPVTPSVVTSNFQHDCNNKNCASPNINVVSGDTIVFALGWYNQSPPSAVTDNFGDSFTLAANASVVSGSSTYYSYVWTALATHTGGTPVTASFANTVHGSISVYDVAGVTTTGLQTSYGTSSPVGSASVASFTPNAPGAVVIANMETSATNDNIQVGSGYTLVAGGGGCGSVSGCSEYKTNVSSAITAPFTMSPSAAYAEVALAFPSVVTYDYYTYIYYATATASGTDTISAAFTGAVDGTVSLYEVFGATSAGLMVSTGYSTTANNQATVTTFTPPTDSFVIGNVETAISNPGFGSGGGYKFLPGEGGGGGCNANNGCSEYDTSSSGGTNVQMKFGQNTVWAEAAIAFPSTPELYYSYLWYAPVATTGTDTITASFSSTVQGSVSLYELTGYQQTSLISTTGTSSSGSNTASTTSFTPTGDAVVIGNVEVANSSKPGFGQGGGYTLVTGGGGGAGCNANRGCSEYATAVAASTTAPMNVGGGNLGWVDVAIAFSSASNPQSGLLVNGYPTMGIPGGIQVVFQVTFTNADPAGRSVTLWPQSEVSIGSVQSGGDNDFHLTHFYVIDGFNPQVTGIEAYTSTTGQFITLPPNEQVVLWFGATEPLGTATSAIDTKPQGIVAMPFNAFFSLTGTFSDGTLYGETIPYPFGVITQANAATSPQAGATGDVVSVTCISSCGYADSASAIVGWITPSGIMTTLTNFTTTSTGNLPTGLTFTVPDAPAGYYTIIVTDYINTVFTTFQHT